MLKLSTRWRRQRIKYNLGEEGDIRSWRKRGRGREEENKTSRTLTLCILEFQKFRSWQVLIPLILLANVLPMHLIEILAISIKILCSHYIVNFFFTECPNGRCICLTDAKKMVQLLFPPHTHDFTCWYS
jgi:hypothetical protein